MQAINLRTLFSRGTIDGVVGLLLHLQRNPKRINLIIDALHGGLPLGARMTPAEQKLFTDVMASAERDFNSKEFARAAMKAAMSMGDK